MPVKYEYIYIMRKKRYLYIPILYRANSDFLFSVASMLKLSFKLNLRLNNTI